MKVLYCILDNRPGGPHQQAHRVSLRLRRHGIETLFLTGRKTSDLWQPDGATVFSLKHLQCVRRHHPVINLVIFCCFLPYNLRRIGRIIRSNRIDIVHVDGVTNFVPALAAWLARRPIVWLYNDHTPGLLRPLILRLVTALSAVVLVQGERLRVMRTGGNPRLNAKTHVLYSCVDPAEFDSDRYSAQQKDRIKQGLGLPPDCAVVGMIGNLNAFKGHVYFIQAAAKIKARIGAVKFLIVGRKLDTDPDYWDRLQRLTAENKLQDDIIYSGFQSDVPSVLAVMDVFVLASILESCPGVVLEAMAMKVPIVATDVGSVSELLANGQAGTIIPPADADAIADAVVGHLTGSSERTKTTTEAARKRVEEMFTVDRVAGRQKDLYEANQSKRECPPHAILLLLK